MKRLLLPLAGVAIASLFLPTGARPAYACSCIVLSPEEHVANADVVVVATVLRLIDDTEDHNDHAFPDVDAVLSVERYLKGTGPEEIVADDPQSGGGCGIFEQLSVGSRYLLFLTGKTSPFKTHLCSGSIPIEGPGLWTLAVSEEHAASTLRDVQAITGPGTLPQDTPAPGESETDDGVPWLPVITAASLAAGVLAAASAILLRRRLTLP